MNFEMYSMESDQQRLISQYRKCIRTKFSLLFSLIGFTFFIVESQAFAAPLPVFADPQFQECFNEQVIANGWQQAEQVDRVVCASRGISNTAGIDQLPNLAELDLSQNPIEFLGPVASLASTLTVLELSKTSFFDLFELTPLTALRSLKLNHLQPRVPANTEVIEQQLNSLLINNPGLTEIGFSGFTINDPNGLFNNLSSNLVSLELSNTRLNFIPVPLNQYSQLQVLDLSHNPLDVISTTGLEFTLKYLDLSGTRLFDLGNIRSLRALTHLFLNDMQFDPFVDPNQLEQDLVQTLQNNPSLTHVGFSGFTLNNPFAVIGNLPINLVSLELRNMGPLGFAISPNQYPQLQKLDISQNPNATMGSTVGLENTLRHLNLNGTLSIGLSDILPLRALTHLFLNDMQFDPFADPNQLEQDLVQTLQNNPSLTHVGFSGFTLNNPFAVIGNLPINLVSLELRNMGPLGFVISPDQYPQLQKLDISQNPNADMGPTSGLEDTLKYLDLSGTRLFSLGNIRSLRALTHLFLNDMQFDPFVDPNQLEQDLVQTLQNNPSLTHVGFSGFTLNNPFAVIGNLPINLVSLELRNMGPLGFAISPNQYPQLQKLDISQNPNATMGPTSGLEDTLKYLDLSGTRLFSLGNIRSLRALTHLFLNDMQFDPFVDPNQLEQDLVQTLQNNPSLTHVGFSGFTLNNPFAVIGNLPINLVSLELRNMGPLGFVISPDQYPQLQKLDISQNPNADMGPTSGLEDTLKYLDLSGTRLFSLGNIRSLRALTHLFLNDMQFDPFVDPNQLEQDLVQTLQNNPSLTHVGFSGFTLNNPFAVIGNLPINLVSLELRNMGPLGFVISPDQYPQLQKLDISQNPNADMGPTSGLEDTLKYLDLSGTRLFSLGNIRSLRALTHLFLNDMQFDPFVDPNQLEQDLVQTLQNNPSLTHVGFSGFTLNNPFAVIGNLPINLVSLELRNMGPLGFVISPDQYPQLQKLDISQNPNADMGPTSGLEDTLKYLDLSGTRLFDLGNIRSLRALTHLFLNDMQFDPFADPNQLEQDLVQTLQNNPSLTHVGFNGFAINDSNNLFSNLSPNLVSLELSNTGLNFVPVPLDQYTRLEVLDLSTNPLQSIGSLFGLRTTLTSLDLSATQLFDLGDVSSLQVLTHLLLNDIAFSGPIDPLQLEQSLIQTLQNNPSLTHVGFNGFAINDSNNLFIGLSPNLVSLELSNTGLNFVPTPLDQFPKLQVLDLSNNPIQSVGPLFSLELVLEYLDLSNTELTNIDELLPLRALKRLFLNHDQAITYVDTALISNLLMNNQGLTHLGLNGVQLQTNAAAVMSALGGLPIDWLEIANTGLSELSLPFGVLERLQYLDASNNQIASLAGIEIGQQLIQLNLANNQITDVTPLINSLPSLNLLNLLGNDTILCADLDALEASLLPEVEFTRPAVCDDGVLPTPEYCAAAGINTHYEWIDSVAVNGVSNVSGNNNGYADFTPISYELPKGVLASIDLSPGFRNSSYSERWAVWIDYDNDGEFTAAEQVLATKSRTDVSGNFTVPASAVNAVVRMRVAMRWGKNPNPCGNFNWGEVEDYSVTITE